MRIFQALLLLLISIAVHAAPIEFYASNNTSEISLENAYARLTGTSQHVLRDEMIHVMQINHVEQGVCNDILGSYQMNATQNVTADNSKVFTMSPYQQYPISKATRVAKQLAQALQQESVAMFVPNQQGSFGKAIVTFQNNKPNVAAVKALLHARLPDDYSQAYSLVLENEYANYADLKVAQIQWLGNKKNLQEIQAAFADEQVALVHGSAYLVYADGQIIAI